MIFHVELRDNEDLLARYPQLEGKLGQGADRPQVYVYDDAIDTSKNPPWWIGTTSATGFCTMPKSSMARCSTPRQEDPACAGRGFYDHGQYPFVFDALFSCESMPAGFGYLDVCKEPQMYIDRLNQVILKNAIMASRPRWFVRQDGIVNEEEYADWDRDFVHYTGSGDPEEHIRPIQVKPVSDIFVSILNNKIEELKETSGNRDFTQAARWAA